MKTFSKRTRVNVLTFLVGPLLLVPALTIAAAILSLINGGRDFISVVGFGLMASVIGLLLFAYPATLLVGMPATILLQKYNLYGVWPVVTIGWISSILISLIINPSVVIIVLFSYCGISVSFGCWYANKKISERL